MPRRYKHRVDDNQKDIVSKLEKIPGVTVAIDHDDIIVGRSGKNFWFEIKNPNVANKSGKVFKSAIRKSQHELKDKWAGHYRIVTSIDEILSELGIR